MTLLVLSELLVAILGVTTAVVALVRLSNEHRYMHQYVFAPLVAIGDALDAGAKASELVDSTAPEAPALAQQALERVRAFFLRYQESWQVVESSLPDALRFRDELQDLGRLGLLEEERKAVDALEAALARSDRPRREDIIGMRAALVRLNDINLRYMETAYDAYDAKRTSIVMFFLAVGAVGVVMAPLLGLAVRRAIVPRVQRLVQKIERFRELGINVPVDDEGGDELAVLAHTLDVSFTAIAARDAERKRFLSVAAHELKTPLTSLKGFAQIALQHRDDRALCDRALAVIDRQATRLARLSQDLPLGGARRERPAPLQARAGRPRGARAAGDR
ncbi:MAG: histidine kinase dimerization/phospho-acceptor domain-containing protein [Minicystis sp.]